VTFRLGSNIDSIRAQRRFSDATGKVSQAYERLSSGVRINKAADDAAGLAVSCSLTSSSLVFAKGLKNINDGLSFLNLAQGALTELASITDRHLVLAEQAANGVYNSTQRKALQDEANALVDEYNRIVSSTSFNGQTVFSGDGPREVRIQFEYGVEGSIAINLGASLSRTIGTGTFGTPVSYNAGGEPDSATMADYNGDGLLDLAVGDDSSSSVGIFIGNGDGTFKNRVNYSVVGGSDSIATADVNGDGVLDLVNRNVTTSAFSVLLGNGNGSFKAQVTFAVAGQGQGFVLGDFNGDNRVDIIGTSYS